MIENVAPILRVQDIDASVKYYVKALRFQRAEWGGRPFTAVERDGSGIYLCEGFQGQLGTWVWIGVDDVEVLHEEIRGKGAHIVMAPTNFGHALEMRVQDVNGHVLRFGSDSKTDRPIEPMTYENPKV